MREKAKKRCQSITGAANVTGGDFSERLLRHRCHGGVHKAKVGVGQRNSDESEQNDDHRFSFSDLGDHELSELLRQQIRVRVNRTARALALRHTGE